jgi:dipeptidyl aminopeptidase/acylaminoacyl peptidase
VLGSKVSPYGSWPSTITASLVAERSRTYDALQVAGDEVYWLESRPLESGRTVVVRWIPGRGIAGLVPPSFDVGSRVNEYGGGSYLATGRSLFVCNSQDQRVYRIDRNGTVSPISPEPTESRVDRYADLRQSVDERMLLCVRERHPPSGVANDLVALPTDGSAPPWTLVEGHDFLSSPRPSPDGRWLAWITSDLPDMPWDASSLWLAGIGSDRRLVDPRQVAGASGESIFQPEWSPEGTLHFISDRSGWWNLYRYRQGRTEPLLAVEAEFGEAQWEFDYSTYAFLSETCIACRLRVRATDRLALLRTDQQSLVDVNLPITSVKPYVRSSGDAIAFIGSSPELAPTVFTYDVKSSALRSLIPFEAPLDSACVSRPQSIEFPTADGQRAYGFYYAPINPAVTALPNDRPPLIIQPHAGPTTDSRPRLDLRVQFFTSRGFAVVAVNYRGSTGFGRKYRDALVRQWGVTDVVDCVSAARYVVDASGIDAQRIVISGASAGGFTALNAAASSRMFAGAVSTSGITDLQAHRLRSPKFQAGKLDHLIGPYPAAAEQYRTRSPIHNASRIACPVLLLHGGRDTVVPPEHSRRMAAALRSAGVPHTYVELENEGHGFVEPANIRRALETELTFYGWLFDLDLPDGRAPLRIVQT